MVGDEISASGALQGRLSSKDFIIIPIFQFSCYYTVGGSMHSMHTSICLQHFEKEKRQIKFFYAFSLCRPHLSLSFSSRSPPSSPSSHSSSSSSVIRRMQHIRSSHLELML